MSEDHLLESQSNLRPNLPDWGVYLAWPGEDDRWIHPEDVSLVRSLIPSNYVFERFRWDGAYYHLRYGQHVIRVRPSLWTLISPIDVHIGELVEVHSKMLENPPGIYRIGDILWQPSTSSVEFHLDHNDLRLDRPFTRSDFEPIERHAHLRSGYYTYDPPRMINPKTDDFLDVGNLLDTPSDNSKSDS